MGYQVGKYILILKLTDERGLFSTYLLSLEVLKIENLGPPFFNPQPKTFNYKLLVG